MELMDAALMYVLKKVFHLAGISLVTVASTQLTLLDRLAMFMAKAAKVSVDVSVWIFHLIKKMAAFIGVKVKEGTDLTVAFIHTVFLKLHEKISNMIWNISQALG